MREEIDNLLRFRHMYTDLWILRSINFFDKSQIFGISTSWDPAEQIVVGLKTQNTQNVHYDVKITIKWPIMLRKCLFWRCRHLYTDEWISRSINFFDKSQIFCINTSGDPAEQVVVWLKTPKKSKRLLLCQNHYKMNKIE